MKKCINHRRWFVVISSLLLSTVITKASMAAAFQLWEQNAAGTGDYHAGGAAQAQDASTNYYNAAGLVMIKHLQVVVGAVGITTDMTFKGSETLQTDSAGKIEPIPPIRQGRAQGGGFNLIPNFHIAIPLTSRFYLGFSETTPFGLSTQWARDSVVRYSATLSQIKTIDLGPSIAYALTDRFSIGAGVDYQYLDGEFDSVVKDISKAKASMAIDFSNNEGSDWAWGWHLGALYQFTPATRIGFSYRSQIVHHLAGNSIMTNLASGHVINRNNNTNTTVTLPPSSTFSIYHAINPKWDIMATAVYTQWSSVQDLILHNVAGPPLKPVITSVVHLAYKNSWNFALGAHYHLNQRWMLRAGVGYDQTPTTDKNRDIRLPGSDRFATAIGAHYRASSHVSVDIGWTHLFVDDSKLNKTLTIVDLSPPLGLYEAITHGVVNGSADVVGLQLSWTMV